MSEEKPKVELEDIIGIVKTDEPTNSVELKKDIYREKKQTIPMIWEDLIKKDPVMEIVYHRVQPKLKEALQYYYEAVLCLDVNLTLEVLATAEAYGVTLEKYYCSDCEYVFYHNEETWEDMDCGNVYAIPENGAPEIISCELHNCPFYKKKETVNNWEDYM